MPTCEIVFVCKDLLFIHEEYHHRISNFYCLPKHLIYLSYIEEEKKNKRKTLLFPMIAKQKKNNFYSSYHMKKSSSKSYYNLRPRFRLTPGSSQRKSATSQQIVEDYCYQCAQEENENQQLMQAQLLKYKVLLLEYNTNLIT